MTGLTKVLTLVPLFGLLVSFTCAQGGVTDQQYESWARERCAELGQPITTEVRVAVVRDSPTFRGAHRPIIIVMLGPVTVYLVGQGQLSGYTDSSSLGNSPNDGPDRFRSDQEAIQEIRSKLGRVLPMQELEFDQLKWIDAGNGPPKQIRFSSKMRVNGYPCEVRNGARGAIHRVTGRIIELHLSTGWTYEPPNIQITPAQARQIACERMGGTPNDWNHMTIKYTASANKKAPAHVKDLFRRRVCRLVYSLGSRYGGVYVDTVNGIIWTSAVPLVPVANKASASTSKTPPQVAARMEDVNLADPPRPRGMEVENVVAIAAGSLLAGYLAIRLGAVKLKR